MKNIVDNLEWKVYNKFRGTDMERKIYKELLKWKKNNISMPLMVTRGKASWKNIHYKKILPRRI